MKIEVISTGEELLDGRVVNSNLSDIAEDLLTHGFRILWGTTVGDEPTRLLDAFERAKTRADVVIVTGGLGPTDDDRTAAILAQLAGVPIVRNAKALASIEDYFAKLQRTMVESNRKQADIPEGAEPILNPVGTAPGISLTVDGTHFFALQGVPREMRYLLQHDVIPKMRELRGDAGAPALLYTYKCFGAGESQFAEKLRDLYPLPTGLDIGYRAIFPEVHIKLAVDLGTEAKNEAQMVTFREQVKARLQRYIYSEDQTTFTGNLGKLLRERGLTLAMAESCTGGLVGQMLTQDSGASDYFLTSLVTYCNEAKANILGVGRDILEQHGAVSEPVARAMAEGARRVGHADFAGAITGVAGPGGGTPEKPVGTVDIAVASKDQTLYQRFQFAGNRDRIRTLSAYAVLQMIRNLVSGESFPPTFER